MGRSLAAAGAACLLFAGTTFAHDTVTGATSADPALNTWPALIDSWDETDRGEIAEANDADDVDEAAEFDETDRGETADADDANEVDETDQGESDQAGAEDDQGENDQGDANHEEVHHPQAIHHSCRAPRWRSPQEPQRKRAFMMIGH